MKTPEKIYLDLGFDYPEDFYFDELEEVTWSKDNASGEGIEYIRSDIAKAEAANQYAKGIEAGRKLYFNPDTTIYSIIKT